jgi:peptidyl-dipeptidase A
MTQLGRLLGRGLGLALTMTLVVTVGPHDAGGAPPARGAKTAAGAKAFVNEVNDELKRLQIRSSTADWIKNTYITDDTERAAADANEALLGYLARAVKDAARFRDVPADPDTKRMLLLLRVNSPLAAPMDPKLRLELTTLSAKLEGDYGKAKSCYGKPETCSDIDTLNVLFAKSRDEAVLRAAWAGWHAAAKGSRDRYTRFVEIANIGAREIGFRDTGDMWRSAYDMPPAAFEQDTERLWQQVKPLYDSLHCYVRRRLAETYGKDKVPAGQPIPAHLLGNMWAQEWANVYPLVEPYKGQQDLNVTAALEQQRWDAIRMVKTGERFFTSLGLPALPKTFWERSMFVKPRDREVVCHASAWDVLMNGDVRIKMCVKPMEDDLTTIHHELGHNYYYLAYNHLPYLYQAGANDGFHEAIGDAITLSMTPAYLKELGLIKTAATDEKNVINVQMKDALEKVAFLPFGLLIDKWRWDVFAGKTKPADYNKSWWDLRRRYQGVAPPIPRADDDFDPGAKYHVPANVPYTRYFLARLLQFQFHRALCQAAGHKGKLHECSVYSSREAGDRFWKMLGLGASKPWPDALAALTGQREVDATALLDYFTPLRAWLDKQNAGQACGW